MLVGKIYGDNNETRRKEGPSKSLARLGLGGALETSTVKGSRLGYRLGWCSFWAMVVVTALFWINTTLSLLGFDSSNGIVGLKTALFVASGFAVVVSHILVFVCDYLTGGDSGPSAYALAVFWGGVVLMRVVVEVLLMFF